MFTIRPETTLNQIERLIGWIVSVGCPENLPQERRTGAIGRIRIAQIYRPTTVSDELFRLEDEHGVRLSLYDGSTIDQPSGTYKPPEEPLVLTERGRKILEEVFGKDVFRSDTPSL